MSLSFFSPSFFLPLVVSFCVVGDKIFFCMALKTAQKKKSFSFKLHWCFLLQAVKEHEEYFHKRCKRLEDEFRDLLTLDVRVPAQQSNGTETHFKTQL